MFRRSKANRSHDSAPKRQRFRNTRKFLSRSADGFIEAVIDVFVASLKRPMFLATLALCGFLIYTHVNENSGMFAKLFPPTSQHSIVKWARANVIKVLGAACFLPVILDASEKYRPIVIIAVVGYVYLIELGAYWEYAIGAVFLHLYLKIKGSYKPYVFLLAVAAYFSGIVISEATIKIATTAATPQTTRAPTTAPPRA